MAPKAAFPPASENGVDWTAVPNTLAFFGAPNGAKSLTTLRGGDDGGDRVVGRGLILGGGERDGEYSEPMGYEWRERCCLD